MDKEILMNQLQTLIKAHKDGLLGGETMPEDSNPRLESNSEQNLLYLTLPMALNYQRNSYKLWESTLASWNDPETGFVFDINSVLNTDLDTLRTALTKHRVALQPNKQPIIWHTICSTIQTYYSGELTNLFESYNYDISYILNQVQVVHKKGFPYLSGNKIANYWLYVLTQYTSLPFKNKSALSIAPDTHVCQASIQLGVSTALDSPVIVALKWKEILHDSGLSPIEIHTPLWLWSRSGFALAI